MFLPPPQSPGEMRSTAAGGALSGPHAQAVEALDKGVPPEDVRTQLVATGHTLEQAKAIVEYACRWRRAYTGHGPEPSSNEPAGMLLAGQRNRLMGVLMVVFGIVVTVGTCALASARGGVVVVCTGIIIGGVALVFRGANQIAQAKLLQASADDHSADDWDAPTEAASSQSAIAGTGEQDWDQQTEPPSREPSKGIQRRSRLGRRLPGQ